MYCLILHINRKSCLTINLKLSSDCKYIVHRVEFEVNQECFFVSGKRLIDAGYTRIMNWQALNQEEHLPVFQLHQSIPVVEVILI